MVCVDAFSSRGRKRSEDHLPNAARTISPPLSIIRVRRTRSAGTTRLYTRLTAAEVRRQLIAQKGYSDEELPTAETIVTKLNSLSYFPKKVDKSQPQKTP
jgi:hypothetical protein